MTVPQNWSELPTHILVNVFRYLPVPDAANASLSCHRWSMAFREPALWRNVVVHLSADANVRNRRLLDAASIIGVHVRTLDVELDQTDPETRQTAVELLTNMRRCCRKLRRLRVAFVGRNPLFYGGREFVDALTEFFLANDVDATSDAALTSTSASTLNSSQSSTTIPPDSTSTSALASTSDSTSDSTSANTSATTLASALASTSTSTLASASATASTINSNMPNVSNERWRSIDLIGVDLSGLSVLYSDQLVSALGDNHRHLRSLNLQNQQLLCRLTPDCLRRLIEACPELEDLRVFYACVSDETLAAFLAKDRRALLSLSLLCQAQDSLAHQNDVSEELWLRLAVRHPGFELTLRFRNTCPFWLLRQVIKPECPLTELHLESYTSISQQLELTADLLADRLRRLYVRSQPDRELDDGLLLVAQACPDLRELHVLGCSLSPDTVDRLLAYLPRMQRYTLTTDQELTQAVVEETWREIISKWR